MKFLCYFSPKSFRAFSSKFSVDSKDTFPPDFPARHPKSQSHLPFLKRRYPFLEPPPGAPSHRPERAACLFSRESGTRQAHALQQQTRLNGEFARSGRGQPEEGEGGDEGGSWGGVYGGWGLQPPAAAVGSGERGGARAARGAGCPIEKAAAPQPPNTLSLLARERGRRTGWEQIREGELGAKEELERKGVYQIIPEPGSTQAGAGETGHKRAQHRSGTTRQSALSTDFCCSLPFPFFF